MTRLSGSNTHVRLPSGSGDHGTLLSGLIAKQVTAVRGVVVAENYGVDVSAAEVFPTGAWDNSENAEAE
jgi:hypothetical protein